MWTDFNDAYYSNTRAFTTAVANFCRGRVERIYTYMCRVASLNIMFFLNYIQPIYLTKSGQVRCVFVVHKGFEK